MKSSGLHAAILLVVAGTARAGADDESSAAVEAQAASSLVAATLDAVTVKGVASESSVAKAKLDEVAGGTGIVDAQTLSRGRNSTLGDILSYQPGVFVQSVGGNDAVKISIRGSGIVNAPGYFREGIKFLFDGIAITGTGGTTYELLNASGTQYTEIPRGGNAFDYGAAALGGAVNFVTHNGYSAPGARVRFEGGSWGLRKTILSYGGQNGGFDWYVNADKYYSHGFRSDYSLSKSKGTVASLGYRFSPKLDTRLLLRYREEFHEDPGALTLPELEADPSQPSPVNLAGRSSGTRPGTVWIGSNTSYAIDDDSRLEVGLAYHEYRHINGRWNRIGDPGHWDWHDFNTSLRYSRVDDWGGHESRTAVSWTSTEHNVGDVRTLRGYDNDILVRYTSFRDSYDRTLGITNNLELNDRLWLESALSAVNVRRKIDNRYSILIANPADTDYNVWEFTPRAGLRYGLTPDVQLFGNVTRAVDAPLDWRYVNARHQIVPLVVQKGTTFELGTRGRLGRLDGSLVLYRTAIDDELLTVVDEVESSRQGTIVTETRNSETPTLHQGVELGLDAGLWEGAAGDRLVLRQAYTYNDFSFEDDPRLGDNRLPGIPRNVYQAKLEYQRDNGFWVGINAEAVSRTPVDYANSLAAPGHTIFGLSAGWEAPSERWRVYLDLKNLADKTYVSTVTSVFNARGNPNTRAFFPGDGFGAFGGVEVRF